MNPPVPPTNRSPKHPVAVGLVLSAICLFSAASIARADHASPLIRQIAASATDAAIDDVIGVHQVAIGDLADRIGRLLVFLPGTTAPPQFYTELIEGAAHQGFHSIGLAYENAAAVNVLCSGMGASGCHESVRREIIFGTDETSLIDVDFNNSIVNRLDRLLTHLETLAPNEGWEAYRDPSGEIRWDMVLVTGHSQGAGHAAFIARFEQVARAVLFSGTEPAPWTQAGDFVTPASAFWAFGHELEGLFGFFQSSWDNIGIPGTPTSVDGASAPFGTSQQLTTANSDCSGDPMANGFYHNCHCVDGFMPPPLPDGTPFFQPVWDELFRLDLAPAPVPSLDRAGLLTLIVMVTLLGSAFAFRTRAQMAPRRSNENMDRCSSRADSTGAESAIPSAPGSASPATAPFSMRSPLTQAKLSLSWLRTTKLPNSSE